MDNPTWHFTRCCLNCGSDETKIVDVRDFTDMVRRRRACKKCGYRWNTVEIDESVFQRLVEQSKTNREENKGVNEGAQNEFLPFYF